MIRIVTIHWKTDRWIDVQLSFLERHVRGAFRVYGALNDFEQPPSVRFHHCATDVGDHAQSLNRLAELVLDEGADGDVLLFMDGDAFPIAPLDERMRSWLAQRPLAAVRRDENLGDPQPHPCFCATTVGFWRDIEGDWSKGPTWRNSEGEEVTDVGANLLQSLGEHGVDWTPLLRSNVRDLHPVLFGVYSDIAYHHGGGFRPSYTRVDNRGPTREAAAVKGRPIDRWHTHRELRRDRIAENEKLSQLVFKRIVADPDFARELFLTPGPPPFDVKSDPS